MYDWIMKFFLVLLLLSGLTYGGYVYYRQSSTHLNTSPPVVNQGKLTIRQASDSLGNLATVLGVQAQNIFDSGQAILSTATSGASEPIINQLVTKTQETLKDLPQKETEKIKYQFCKGVVTEYEKQNN